ncbi:MarR family transcriptional regulator [Nonomuraea glycinis]|nr:MarR family transcriptional regulator [Nonomuraea glycinis]MCA2182540.1 MarR family transcriptional regulator [Nonomuraea glycinis]
MVSKHRRQVALRRLHESLVDLISFTNLPRGDEELIAEAGVVLDQALFRLLVGVERFGPISVGEIAERTDRDHTTVSRQVAKLAELGLIERRSSPLDKRVKEAMVTAAGRRVTDALDAARMRLSTPVFEHWSDRDLLELERLMRRFADDLLSMSAMPKETDT